GNACNEEDASCFSPESRAVLTTRVWSPISTEEKTAPPGGLGQRVKAAATGRDVSCGRQRRLGTSSNRLDRRRRRGTRARLGDAGVRAGRSALALGVGALGRRYLHVVDVDLCARAALRGDARHVGIHGRRALAVGVGIVDLERPGGGLLLALLPAL